MPNANLAGGDEQKIIRSETLRRYAFVVINNFIGRLKVRLK